MNENTRKKSIRPVNDSPLNPALPPTLFLLPEFWIDTIPNLTLNNPETKEIGSILRFLNRFLPMSTGAKEVGELEKHLGVLELAGMPGSACIRVQPACAITGEGLHEGLDTLYQLILKRRKLAKLNRKRAR